ncbi:hypothetical protein JCM5296_004956 [Sporobolomyces johnsonii]
MTKKEENEENICRWLECLQQFDTAEELFNHVCSLHIGRKSAGTLSLECRWTGCHAKASKRDHLTSHCRVHIALKPHICTICTKAFKRPQDLKKHEKIHTEEHHATHKQAKAVIAHDPSPAPAFQQPHQQQHPPHFGHLHPQTDKGQPVQQVPYPFSFPTIGYPYPVFPGQHGLQNQLGQQLPAHLGGGGVDTLAQYIALQQQLNSQAQAAVSQGLAMPNMSGIALPPGYPIQLGQNPFAVGPQGISFLPQGVFPYGGATQFAFSTSGNGQPQFVQAPQPQPNARISTAPPPAVPSSTPHHPQQQQQSLYPSLPASLYPSPTSVPLSIKQEDHPSPANSQKSHYSSSLSPAGVPALSPPSVSTPENSFSPSPDLESDNGARRAYSGNAVAGKKRGFDEAAGQFLGNLKNKRFQDQDTVNAQLDALSSFLLTPEMSNAPALTPARTADDSSSSNGSDYGRPEGSFDREEVDTINQLLLSLGQTLDDPTTLPPPTVHDPLSQSSVFSHHPEQHPIALLPASYAQSNGSLYPTLPSLDRTLSAKSAPHHASLSTNPYAFGTPTGQEPHPLASVRLSKPAAAPTIANDYRQPQYHHVARLQRAAPIAEEQAAMEVDDEVTEAATALLMGKGYSASSVRSTSQDPTDSPSRPKLPPLAAAIRSASEGPRLAPIHTSVPSSSSSAPTAAPPTLPHIRDILSPYRSTDIPESPLSPTSSSASTFPSLPLACSSATSRPLYPSLSSLSSSSSSSTSRPVSAGGVERLTHRVHKMRLPSTSSEVSTADALETASSILATEDLSASSDEDDEDHPNARFKKSRVESPLPMAVKEEPDEDDLDELKDDSDEDKERDDERDEQARLAARRKATIAYLVLYVNAKYREHLAKKGVAKLRKAIKPSPMVAKVEGAKVEA